MQRSATGWKATLLLFFLTSVIESYGYSHLGAFLPVYIQGMQVHHAATWVGVLNALTFVVGLPLVPLWSVWANRYGGKAVIIRSAYVEALVFTVLGFNHTLPGVVIAMAMTGFQLGNTGIMLSSLRRLVPNDQMGSAVSTFSVSSPVGMALGPLIGGWLVRATPLTLHDLYFIDAVLSVLTGTMLLLFYRETAPAASTASSGLVRESAWRTAWKSVRFTFSLSVTWILFGIYSLLTIARQMVNPYIPVAIEQIYRHHENLTVAIGAMMGLTALVGAMITVVAGRIGDGVGFTKVLAIAFAVNIPACALLGFSHHLLWFGLLLTVHSAAITIGGAMIFALFSTLIPESHRSTALNLVYLPMYVGGIAGPLLASGLTRFGVAGPFGGAAVVSLIGICDLCRFLCLASQRLHGGKKCGCPHDIGVRTPQAEISPAGEDAVLWDRRIREWRRCALRFSREMSRPSACIRAWDSRKKAGVCAMSSWDRIPTSIR
jgi:DHA1 family multidrug resistance protein-like MFS transporter